MVKCIRLVDGEGKGIPSDMIEIIDWDVNDHIKIMVKNYNWGFSQKEVFTLMNLINDKVKYGVHVEEAREYINLLDKLEKIIERNTTK